MSELLDSNTDPDFERMTIEEIIIYVEQELSAEPGEVMPFEIDGVIFEVVAKIKATREDGATIDTVAGPIQLIRTPSLYRALFNMTSACTVPEFQLDPDELMSLATRTVAVIVAGDSLKWTKPKKESR